MRTRLRSSVALPLGINREKAFSVEATVGQRRADSNAERRAPGFRNRNTSGALGSVGSSGYCYSSSVNGTNGMDLDFSTRHFNPGYAGNRGDAFQLRCLSE